jgi:hypothetical protein
LARGVVTVGRTVPASVDPQVLPTGGVVGGRVAAGEGIDADGFLSGQIVYETVAVAASIDERNLLADRVVDRRVSIVQCVELCDREASSLFCCLLVPIYFIV